MRICPACKTRYPEGEVVCARDGENLVEDSEAISFSDTVENAAAVVAGTPAPLRAKTPESQKRTPTPHRMTPSPARTEPLAPGDDHVVGAHLAGRYEVTRKIGEGGMGAVYEARHSLIVGRVTCQVKAANALDRDYTAIDQGLLRLLQGHFANTNCGRRRDECVRR